MTSRPTSGILLLNKETGTSSARALYPVKRRFPGRKIGHTGTLDPFAAGLLVVLIGQATRLSRFFLSLDKRYGATIRFGVETDTLDPEGSSVAEAPLPDPTSVHNVRERFLGVIEQEPPAYSALKIGGKRAYKLARAGNTVSIPPRPVVIHDLTLVPCDDVESSGERWLMTVHCGSGTYIRALARDIGRAAGSVASLDALTRTGVGPFLLEDAITTEKLDDDIPAGALLSIADAVTRLGAITTITVSATERKKLRMGIPPYTALEQDTVAEITTSEPRHTLCIDESAEAIALLEHGEQNQLRYSAVFPTEDTAL